MRQVQWTIHLHQHQQLLRPQRKIISSGPWMHLWCGHAKNDEKSWKLVQICIIQVSAKSLVRDGKRWATKRNSPSTKNNRVWVKFTWRSIPTTDTGKSGREEETDSTRALFSPSLDRDQKEHVSSTVRKCVGKCRSYHRLIEKLTPSLTDSIQHEIAILFCCFKQVGIQTNAKTTKKQPFRWAPVTGWQSLFK